MEETGSVFVSAEEETPLDMNIFLALQAPIYAYCVGHNEKSGEVSNIWFGTICSEKGLNVFGNNLKKALDYFKLMYHAFFQNAILPSAPEVPQGELVEASFLEMQKQLKSTIAAIATEMDDL